MPGPTNTVVPVLTYPGQTATNAPLVGQVLTCDSGTWTTTTPPVAETYEWYRGYSGSAIAGAPKIPTYTLVAADVGAVIRCLVGAIDGSGVVSAYSTASPIVRAVAGAAPMNTVAPSISSTPVIGVSLPCSSGTWVGDSPITYSYQWQTYASGSWVNILGEISAAYTPKSTDVGQLLRCVVLATNGTGSLPAASNAEMVSATIQTPLATPIASVQRQHRGPKWTRGVDGILETEKQYEDIDVDPQDWSDALGGESIVSATWSTDGITINSSSNTDTTTTVSVTGVGSCHVDIATSGGRTFREYFKWKRLHRPIMNNYGGGDCIPGDYR